MRQLSFALLACSVLTGAAIRAADESKGDGKTNDSDRAQVTRFFKEHVIGKTLATPKTKFKWDDNKMEGDYEDQVIYNNFTETAKGFGFDVTSVSKQTLYDLDKEGKRLQPGRDFSGTFVVRYEICERASTKKLTGISRPLCTTTKAPSPEGTATLVTGDEGRRRQADLERNAAGLRRLPRNQREVQARFVGREMTISNRRGQAANRGGSDELRRGPRHAEGDAGKGEVADLRDQEVQGDVQCRCARGFPWRP
jgi:hypothetical protein